MKFLFIPLALILSMFILFSCGSGIHDKPLQEQYHPEWKSPSSADLVNVGRALIKNDVKVCGEYYVRYHKEYSGEYLLACTKDGNTWHYFQVWDAINEVQEVAAPSIIPPVRE